MKLTLFLLFSAFISFLVQAQEIPAKANTAVITMPDSNNLHKKIIKILSDKGYSVRNAEKLTATIHTEAKSLKNCRVSLHAETKGNEIILSGNIVVVGQGSMPIENKGAKGTPIFTAFEEMEKVAKAFGGKIIYEIR